MKIIDNRANIETIFGELRICDVFTFLSGESVYMKTTETNDFNCVNLINGCPAYISGDDYVTVVNATLTLER